MENSNISRKRWQREPKRGGDLVKRRKCSKGKRKVGLVGRC